MHQPSTNSAFDAEREYHAIEEALLESARGRWFLAEHSRRARRLDSALLEDALGRLTTILHEPPALLGQLAREIEQISASVADARSALLARSSQSFGNDAPPSGTTATGGILTAAEDLHELAWSLVANEIDPQSCEQIAKYASQIYAMSHAQAAESRRAIQLAQSLDGIGARLADVLQTLRHELQAEKQSVEHVAGP